MTKLTQVSVYFVIMPSSSHSLTELVSFLDGLPEPRIVMDREYRIVAANEAYARIFGGNQPIIGRTCYEVSHRFTVPCEQAGESCPLKRSLETGQPQRVLHLHHTPRGEEHVHVETTPIRDASGNLLYFVETLREVRQASSKQTAQGLVGRSPRFMWLLEQVVRVAPSDSAVLILGETGTGKELVARAIHEASNRSEGAFVAVDCAGLSEALFESEMFGHERGAFTGASHRKLGLVEAASGGTLFLDEIGDLPLELQVKLLRLLETATYRRVGGLDTLPADFRLIAATHRDLQGMVREGSFRQDLYYRINVFPIRTPALHERPEDISLLAASLLERVDRKTGRQLSADALDWLSRRKYPGNIRELRNLMERVSLMADQELIEAADLQAIHDGDEASWPYPTTSFHGEEFTLTEVSPLWEVEQRYVQWATAREKNTQKTAKALGISVRTLYRKLQATN